MCEDESLKTSALHYLPIANDHEGGPSGPRSNNISLLIYVFLEESETKVEVEFSLEEELEVKQVAEQDIALQTDKEPTLGPRIEGELWPDIYVEKKGDPGPEHESGDKAYRPREDHAPLAMEKEANAKLDIEPNIEPENEPCDEPTIEPDNESEEEDLLLVKEREEFIFDAKSI